MRAGMAMAEGTTARWVTVAKRESERLQPIKCVLPTEGLQFESGA